MSMLIGRAVSLCFLYYFLFSDVYRSGNSFDGLESCYPRSSNVLIGFAAAQADQNGDLSGLLSSDFTDYILKIIDIRQYIPNWASTTLTNEVPSSELLQNIKETTAPFVSQIQKRIGIPKKSRIVLSYDYGNCGMKLAESSTISRKQQSEIIRLEALSKLSAKISEYLLPQEGGILSGQAAPTVSLSTKYLDALRMEVATVPEGMSEFDLVEMAQSIPCIQRAYVDEDKYGKDEDVDEPFMSKTRRLQDDIDEVPIWNDGGVIDSYNLINSLENGQSFCDVNRTKCTWSKPLLKMPDELSDEALQDEHFVDQWYLKANEPASAQVESAWPWWTGTEPSMVVAVIDSGCDLTHPDMKDKYWKNPNEICDDGIDNDGNGYIDDCYGYDFANDDPNPDSEGSGHGTGAAGIIAAVSNNSEGISGVCWGCKIMCLKFIGGGRGLVSDQVQAIDYAVRMGAKISNNSYGGYGMSELERDAIRRAQMAGHLFVCSAGNNNLDTDLGENDHTPSVYDLPNIIVVGGTDYSGKKAEFSNYGYRTVDVFAPAIRIRTTKAGGGYVNRNGTSFAAPTVTGIVALIWSAFPQLSYEEVKQSVIDGCLANKVPSGPLSRLSQCGGRVNTLHSLYVAALRNDGRYPGKRELELFGGLRKGSMTASPPMPVEISEVLPDRKDAVDWNVIIDAFHSKMPSGLSGMSGAPYKRGE